MVVYLAEWGHTHSCSTESEIFSSPEKALLWLKDKPQAFDITSKTDWKEHDPPIHWFWNCEAIHEYDFKEKHNKYTAEYWASITEKQIDPQ